MDGRLEALLFFFFTLPPPAPVFPPLHNVVQECLGSSLVAVTLEDMNRPNPPAIDRENLI
jgi:hypothetical protein